MSSFVFALLSCLYIFCGSASASATETVGEYARFCDEGARSSELVSGWSDKKKEGLCIKVKCDYGEESARREQCYRPGTHPNTIEVHFNDTVEGPNLYALRGSYKEIVLVPGETCFNQCQPEQTKVLGLWSKEVAGLERESCKECFKEREETPKRLPYLVAEANKWLYPGMKCHHRCKFEKGEFSGEREYTQQCKKCIGLDGHEPESFTYLLTKSGSCREFDSEQATNPKHIGMPVPRIVCDQESGTRHTVYKAGTSYSLKVMILGRKPECFEVDQETSGDLYQIEVDSSFCMEEAVENGDRVDGKDTKEDNNPVRRSQGGSGAAQH